MREIKFRGKRKDNGEWVYGSLIVWPDGDVEVTDFQASDSIQTFKHMVDAGTVGQFTGLKDSKGNNIYEGDIVQFVSTDAKDYAAEWDFENLGNTPVRSEVTWNNDAIGFRLKKSSRFKVVKEMLDLIGNIHDNPELLKQTTVQESAALESAEQDRAMGVDGTEG